MDFLTIKDVSNIRVADGELKWNQVGDSETTTCTLDQVVLVVKASDGSDKYLTCLLQENENKKSQPFELTTIRIDNVLPELQQYVVEDLPSYLNSKDGSEVDIIVSVKSGTNQALKLWENALKPLLQLLRVNFGLSLDIAPYSKSNAHPQAYRVLMTESEESVRDFSKDLWAAEATRRRYAKKSRTVILLSGDGGVVDLLNGSDEDLEHTSLPMMALLPLGTGNALFHSTHKPAYQESAASPLVIGLRTLFKGVAAELPVFRASFSPRSRIITFTDKSDDKATKEPKVEKEEKKVAYLNGAIVASYGFHASLVYESDTPEYRVHGRQRFTMVAQELLKMSHPYRAKVEVRSAKLQPFRVIPREAHAYVLATVVSDLEKTFTISPETKPLDHSLHLVHFGPVGGERTMEVMTKAYDNGKHVGMKWDDGEAVGYESIDEVRITIKEDDERWRKVCVDGTIVGIPHGGHMTVRRLERGPFRVLAPPGTLSDPLLY